MRPAAGSNSTTSFLREPGEAIQDAKKSALGLVSSGESSHSSSVSPYSLLKDARKSVTPPAARSQRAQTSLTSSLATSSSLVPGVKSSIVFGTDGVVTDRKRLRYSIEHFARASSGHSSSLSLTTNNESET